METREKHPPVAPNVANVWLTRPGSRYSHYAKWLLVVECRAGNVDVWFTPSYAAFEMRCAERYTRSLANARRPIPSNWSQWFDFISTQNDYTLVQNVHDAARSWSFDEHIGSLVLEKMLAENILRPR